MKILEILLLPVNFYKKITTKRKYLYAGIVFVGIVDLIFSYITDIIPAIFAADKSDKLVLNLLIMLVSFVLIGLADVFFFAIPLFDLFKRFKQEGPAGPASTNPVILMKIYALAHIPILPLNILIYYFGRNLTNDSNVLYIEAVLYGSVILLLWLSAIITRGINSVYNFLPLVKRLILVIIFIWNFILGIGLEYIITNWLFKLFR
jgi:hypothetical protein